MARVLEIGMLLIGMFAATVAISAAQIPDGSLTGRIVEGSTNTPMERANVLLFNAGDGSQVSGTTTDGNGIFNFSNLPNDFYYLQIRFVGFETLTTRSFAIENEGADLGTLAIAVSPIVLGYVDVTAERETFTNSIDRKVYNVERDIFSQTGSASDLLQNIPSVSVDVDGNVSLRGAPNVTVFVNGQPSLLMRKNSAVALQQIPANTIERIEVITNPSAKYRPDGVRGIINIVLKKKSRYGFNGIVLANAGNPDRYNANATMNFSPGKVNLFGSYGFRRNNSPRISTDSRIEKDSLSQITGCYDNSSSSSAKPLAHIANLGLDCAIDDKNKVGISGDWFYQDSYHTQDSQTTLRDGLRRITTDFATDRTNDEYEKEYETNLDCEHSFDGENHVLDFELNYSGYDEKENNHYHDAYTAPDSFNARHHILVQKGGHLAEFHAGYSYPIDEETELEAGYVGEFMRDDIRYSAEDYDPQSTGWITDFNKTNRFLFRQDIHALYATFGHSIEDLSFLVGLRAEQALITSDLVTSDSTIPNDYFRFYPTLHLAYDSSDNHEFQINYSRRVRRADSDEHNPYPEYSDPRNMEAGNPKIKPEQTHSIEFGYHLKHERFSVVPTVYYRYNHDVFTEIRRSVNDSTMLTTFANLANDRSAGMEFIVSGDPDESVSLNLSADAFYQVIDASNLGYSDEKSTTTWNAKLAANLHFTSSNLIQVYAYYRSSQLTPQGKRLPSFLLNLGLRQDLFNQRASLTLTVSDVFRSLEWKRRIDTPILYENTTSERNSRITYVGFTYRFGKSAREGNDKQEFEFEDTKI